MYIFIIFVFIHIVASLPARHESIKLPLIRRSKLHKRSLLYNQQNIEYLVKINIGTPSQVFLVSIDTGSADLWVPSSQCPTKQCPYSKYNVNTSSTYQDANVTFAIQYGAGSIQGSYIQDKVQLDKLSTTQTFGIVTSAKDGIISTATDANGILGLGFPALAASSDTEQAYSPFVFHLYQQGMIKNPVFAVSLANKEIEIGSYQGEVQYVDVLKNINPKTKREDYTFWSVRLNSVQAGLQTFELNKSVILDTGTTLSYLTRGLVEDMLHALNATYTYDKDTHLYSMSCDERKVDKTVTLELDQGVRFSLAMKDLVTSLDGDETCLFGFTYGYDASDTFVLGDSVLRSLYLVFDFGKHKVGLANAVIQK